MSHLEATWWKASCPKQPSAVGAVATVSGSCAAVWARVAFTAILLLSPQAWVPAW